MTLKILRELVNPDRSALATIIDISNDVITIRRRGKTSHVRRLPNDLTNYQLGDYVKANDGLVTGRFPRSLPRFTV